jgi:hypothetical protein
MILSGGKGSSVKISYADALFDNKYERQQERN